MVDARAPVRPEAPTQPSTRPASAGQQEIDALLARAVDEAARLLQADGAMVYLVDPAEKRLRFAVDAGIRNPEARQLIRDLALPVGVGLFGHAVATGEVVVSTDYRRDKRFPHSEVADRIATTANMRSMAAAPLLADGEVLGALGAYSSQIDDFDEAEVALLRALADHAAGAIANQRLIEQLARSQEELARRVDAQRTLGEISARIAVIREPTEVLQSVVDAARRLIGSDGAHLTLMQPGGQNLRPAVVVGGNAAWTEEWLARLDFPVNGGINGLAAGRGEVIATEDYRADPRIPHAPDDESVADRLGLRGMAAAPLRSPGGEVIGTLAASFETVHTFTPDELALLQGLADQGAIAISNARLTEELSRHAEELAHRVDAQRTLAAMAAQLTSLRDPVAVLRQTLEEAVRLLKGDGGQIGMVSADDEGVMRWGDGHSLIRGQMSAFTEADRTTAEEGVSGRAIRDARTTWTDDYLTDDSFRHDTASDDVVRRLGIRSVIASPLISEEGAIGAIGVYSESPGAFNADDGELLGLLADQAAIVLTNARLNAEGEVTAEKLAHRVEAQRTLGEIAASITSLRDPSAVLTRAVAEAKRLLEAEHVVIHQVRSGTRELADYRESLGAGPDAPPIDDTTVSIGQGIAGRAVAEGRVAWTGDYLADESFAHTDRADEWIKRYAYSSQMSAPLIADSEPLGAISAYSSRVEAFDQDDAQLLGALASQAAIVLGNARLYEELERRIEAQRSLGEIATRITAIRDPGDILQLTLDEAVRLLDADGGRIELVAETGGLHWAFGHSAIDLPIERDETVDPVILNEGVSGRAVIERRVVRTGDYLGDTSFTHAEAPDRYIRQHAIRSVMSAPLIGEDGAIGSLTVHSQARDAFDEANAELLEVLASQAAIAVTNARLYEQLRERADAQRSLAEIAAQIASLHDPLTVIQRAVADAARLLRADRAQVNLVAEGGTHLDRPIAAAPVAPSPDDVTVPIGSGIAGMAAAQRKVRWTGDYLADQEFPHDEGDAWIEAQDIHSMMAAPLLGPDRLIGTITVQATAANAFNADGAELLKLLADQAAIALTNARLYAEVEESERRYRHLVDNSPDIVWSVDADGRFTFFSDSLEARTGWKPEQLLGQPFAVMAAGETLAMAAAAWERLREDPEREQRVRLDLPLPDGRISQTEVAMTGTIVDGRFAGAHGAVRDISERERLEGDLRSQAAELAASQERAHLARELHDSVTQALFSMGLTLRTLELLLESDPVAAMGKLAELRELQKDALAEMRTLIFELRPSSLESDGLVQALRTHATAVQRRTGLTIVVDAEPIDRLPLPAEEALYRIGQEALHNVVKHANAQHATLRIHRDGERVKLSVTDDGVGFAPDQVPRGHLGLIGMRQRADLVGGELRLESVAGEGTLVEASVPAGEDQSAE